MSIFKKVRNIPQLLSENLRAMVMVGLFVAMGIVLQVFSIQMPLMRIGISPIPTIVSGILLGPIFGGITGLLKDVVGFIVAPPASGSFFPPITIIQMLYGILPPLLLPVFRGPVDWVWKRLVRVDTINNPGLRWLAGLPARLVVCYLVVVVTQFINGGLLMPAALNLLIDGQITMALWLARFSTRIPQQVIFLIGYPAITYAVVEALDRVPARMGVFRAAALSRLT
jgi:ECF transporter S component (folate family)